MAMTSFKEFYEDIKWFEELLRSNDIALHKESGTQKSLNELKNLADYHLQRGGQLEIDNEKFREKTRRALGIVSQIWALRKCHDSAKIKLSEKIKLYKSKEVNLLSSEEQSQNRDFAWELMAFCSLSMFAQKPSFNEPDIVCDYMGKRIGFPCKVLYSKNSQQQSDQIIKGVKQLEKSYCDLGFVLVNCSNQIQHNDFFIKDDQGEFLSHPTPEAAMSKFSESLLSVHNKLTATDGSYNERICFDRKNNKERKKTFGIIYYGQTLALVQKKPMLLSNAVLHLRQSDDQHLKKVAQEIGHNFNVATYQMNFK